MAELTFSDRVFVKDLFIRVQLSSYSTLPHCMYLTDFAQVGLHLTPVDSLLIFIRTQFISCPSELILLVPEPWLGL